MKGKAKRNPVGTDWNWKYWCEFHDYGEKKKSLCSDTYKCVGVHLCACNSIRIYIHTHIHEFPISDHLAKAPGGNAHTKYPYLVFRTIALKEARAPERNRAGTR